MATKQICICIPTVSVGGAERVVSILANHLVNEGYKISIVLLYDRVSFELDDKINIVKPPFELQRNFKHLIGIVKYYRRTIKELNPDVIFSFLEFYNEIVMLSLIGIEKRIFLFDRNTPYLKEQNGFQKVLKKYFYPKADGVVVQTELSAKNIIKKGLNKNVKVLPNPIRKMSHQWAPSTKKTIVSVGSLEPQKNHQYLIDIFAEINPKDWELHIIGGGSLHDDLTSQIERSKAEEKIKLLGIQKNVPEILSKSTIFAFPSLWEGFPNALLEALCVGVPCISNDCHTGPSELIQDNENGFLGELDNAQMFKDKLIRLMEDESLRDKFSKNSKNIEAKYSTEKVSISLTDFVFNK